MSLRRGPDLIQEALAIVHLGAKFLFVFGPLKIGSKLSSPTAQKKGRLSIKIVDI